MLQLLYLAILEYIAHIGMLAQKMNIRVRAPNGL